MIRYRDCRPNILEYFKFSDSIRSLLPVPGVWILIFFKKIDKWSLEKKEKHQVLEILSKKIFFFCRKMMLLFTWEGSICMNKFWEVSLFSLLFFFLIQIIIIIWQTLSFVQKGTCAEIDEMPPFSYFDKILSQKRWEKVLFLLSFVYFLLSLSWKKALSLLSLSLSLSFLKRSGLLVLLLGSIQNMATI